MQEILVDAVIVGLFVFLFAAMSSGRGDVRLRLWTAGWLSILAHFLAELWQPSTRVSHIEVTETAAMHNVADVTEQMKALSAEGIEFSIDDFGTGHSSLARLSHLGASILKIDKSFVTPGCAENAQTIMQAIITMAHTLGHKVVAEGVETKDQFACLLDLDCDLFQGYLLSRPISPDQIPALLGSVHPAFDKPVPSETLRLVERVHA